jgi:hypothetical protein
MNFSLSQIAYLFVLKTYAISRMMSRSKSKSIKIKVEPMFRIAFEKGKPPISNALLRATS